MTARNTSRPTNSSGAGNRGHVVRVTSRILWLGWWNLRSQDEARSLQCIAWVSETTPVVWYENNCEATSQRARSHAVPATPYSGWCRVWGTSSMENPASLSNRNSKSSVDLARV